MCRAVAILSAVVLLTACSEQNIVEIAQPQSDFIAGFCPDGFKLLSTGSNGVDVNGDGYICYLKTVDERGNLIYVEVDNDVPPETIGTCPPPFTPMYVLDEEPRDRNRNRIVCVLTHQNGQTIIDDNHR